MLSLVTGLWSLSLLVGSIAPEAEDLTSELQEQDEVRDGNCRCPCACLRSWLGRGLRQVEWPSPDMRVSCGITVLVLMDLSIERPNSRGPGAFDVYEWLRSVLLPSIDHTLHRIH